MTSDLDLLQRFARENSQEAFGEIVRRHVNLVYSAALRQVRSPQLAEDVTQSVFADLARDARQLKPDTILTAWLYAVARRTAIDAVRKESRRQLREQIAMEMNRMNATADDWTQIAPLLDDAMAALDDTDRTAILLRYFENKSLRDVGASLNISDDAAQKRVSRAVESLRELFTGRRIAIGAGGIAVLISANAVKAAPVGLVSIISAAALAGSTVQTSTLVATTKAIAMTTLQKSIIVAALAGVAGTGLYAARQNTRLQSEIQTLQQQQAPLIDQIQQLQQDYAAATNQVMALQAENTGLESNSNNKELLRLRGEVTRLENSQTETKDDPSTSAAQAMAARVKRLKDWLEQHPDENIPELKLLTDQEWLRCAATFDKLDTDDEIRAAYGYIRESAKNDFAWDIGRALDNYISHNNGQLPNAMQDLMPCFESSVNADDAMLARYQILQTGNLNQFPQSETLVAESAPPADSKYDMIFKIGAFGFAYQDVSGAMGGGGSRKFTPGMIRDMNKFARQ